MGIGGLDWFVLLWASSRGAIVLKDGRFQPIDLVDVGVDIWPQG